MIKAGRADKQHIIHLLAHAFEANQSVNYIIKDGDDRLSRVKALMDYSFELCFRFGAVFLSEDRSACALVLYPDKKRYGLFALLQDIKLILFAMGLGNLPKALRRDGLIKDIQPDERKCYLWFIGVLPLWQGKGKGSQLLREIKALAVSEQRPVYLETSTLTNLPWYQKHGFSIYHELDLGYTLYFLKCTN